MAKHEIVVTDKAAADITLIYSYIAGTLCAPQAALRQYGRIAHAIETLKEFPERYSLFECEPERSKGIRLLRVDNYSVIYCVRDTVVTVLRVLYSASDILSRMREP